MSQKTTNYPVNTEKLSSQHGGSREFGPLMLIYNLDLTQEKITVTAKLMGTTIGTRVLDIKLSIPQSIDGSISFYSAKVDLIIDSEEKRLNYNVSIDGFGSKIYKGSGALLEWFNQI